MERFVCVSCFRLFGYSISIQNTTEEAKKKPTENYIQTNFMSWRLCYRIAVKRNYMLLHADIPNIEFKIASGFHLSQAK